MQKIAIYLQLTICNTKARVGILFEKDSFDQLGWRQNYTNRTVYITQLISALVVDNAINITT